MVLILSEMYQRYNTDSIGYRPIRRLSCSFTNFAVKPSMKIIIITNSITR